MSLTSPCDGGRCGPPPAPPPPQLLSLVGYEDGHVDVPVRSNTDRGEPRGVLVGDPPSHGEVTVATDGVVTYRPTTGFTGTDAFTLSVTAFDWTRRGVAATVAVRQSYLVRPTTFTELRQGVPPGEAEVRSELEDEGEYALVRISVLCERLRCAHSTYGDVHVIRYRAAGMRWAEGNTSVNDLSGDYQQLPLPAVPVADGADWWIPLRFTAELLGFSTAFDPVSRNVRVFMLLPELTQVSLRVADKIVGADVGTTRLIAAHESADTYWLLYDATSELVRMRKSDFTYTKLEADPSLGAIHGFAITARGDIYAGTSLGLILRWQGDHFEKIGGDGSRTLGPPGDVLPLAEFKAAFVADMVATEDGGVLYVHDWVVGALFAIDLEARTVTSLADAGMIGGLTNLALHHGDPQWVGFSGMRTIDPDTLTIGDNACYRQLISPEDITAARYVSAASLWLLLDAKNREIVEARIPTGPGLGDCRIERRTFAGDASSYLFTFATTNDEQGDGALVVDNSSRMLIRYRIGGTLSATPPSELGRNASFAWLGPTMAVQRGDSLFIVANRTHQVLSHGLVDGRTSVVMGSGEALRDRPQVSEPLRIDIGFPSAARFVAGELWVGDNYSRKIVATDGVRVRDIFGSTDPAYMSAVSSFDQVGQKIYIADHGLGLIFAYTPGAAAPDVVAGASDLDQARRSAGSIAEMKAFATVRFGSPVWVSAFAQGRLLVVDDGRKGIWLLDPADRSVRPIAGFRTLAAGSTWGFVGNTGMAAIDARIDGLATVTYDAKRRVLLVPSRVSRKIVFIREDLEKTCEADLRGLTIAPQQAFFLEDGRLVVVDHDASAVLFFSPPDLSCLATGHPD